MTDSKELAHLIERMRAAGATVSVQYDDRAKHAEGRNVVAAISIEGAKGIGPHAMTPIGAAERMREFLSKRSSRPRVGDPVTCNGETIGHVSTVDGDICWTQSEGAEPRSFIWRFKDGLNAMHVWPTKDQAAPLARCPGHKEPA